MTLGELAYVDQLDRLVGEVEQADGVYQVGAAAAEPLGEVRRGDAEVVEEGRRTSSLPRSASGLRGRGFRSARARARSPSTVVVDQRGDRGMVCELRGSPAAFAGNQLVAAGRRGRTITGCSTPRSRIESASETSEASSKRLRGWRGFGWIWSTGRSRSRPRDRRRVEPLPGRMRGGGDRVVDPQRASARRAHRAVHRRELVGEDGDRRGPASCRER